jgi:hypothetical protein
MEIESLHDAGIAVVMVILKYLGKPIDAQTAMEDFGNALREVVAYRQTIDKQRGENRWP